jgi:(p)ppGpp synthase/HD superfamily hydrolase
MNNKYEIVRKAFLLTEKYHKYQVYGEDQPYMIHLLDVVNALIEFGHDDPVILAAAWLHDIIEDTPVNYYFVQDAVGARVAEIVFALTDELGRSRKDRKKLTIPKLCEYTDNNGDGALTVKLADWIANVRECYRGDPKKLQMYQKDWEEFVTTLRNLDDDGNLEPMWEELEQLLTKGV